MIIFHQQCILVSPTNHHLFSFSIPTHHQPFFVKVWLVKLNLLIHPTLFSTFLRLLSLPTTLIISVIHWFFFPSSQEKSFPFVHFCGKNNKLPQIWVKRNIKFWGSHHTLYFLPWHFLWKMGRKAPTDTWNTE